MGSNAGLAVGPLKLDWLETILEKTFSQKPKSVQVRGIGDGTGFLSFVYAVNVTWPVTAAENNGHALPTRLILKMPTAEKIKHDEEQSATVPGPSVEVFVQNGHNVECSLYDYFKHIEPEAHCGSNGHFPVPFAYSSQKFVATNDRHDEGSNNISIPYLLLSDLSDKARTPNIAQGLTLEQCRSVVKQLARIQAQSVLDRSWADLPELLKNDNYYTLGGLTGWMADAKVCAQKINAALPEISSIDPGRLEAIADVQSYASYAQGTQGQRVMVHGDLWLNNLMFGIDKTINSLLSSELVAILDWQLTFEGCWSKDISFLLVSSLPWKTRKQHELQLLTEYWQCFKDHLLNSHHQIKDHSATVRAELGEFTLGNLVNRYRAGLKHTAIQYLVQIAYTLADERLSKKYSKQQLVELVMRYMSILAVENLKL